MSYSYVDLRREAIFESVPARTDLAGFLLIHFKHYTENVPELENATSEIDIITKKALKTPIFASTQLDVYEGRAALADRKTNKVAATSRRRAFAAESRYDASATEGAYEVFPENTAAYERYESSGSYSDAPPGYGEDWDFCKHELRRFLPA